MAKELRALIIGMGYEGKMALKYLPSRGVTIVGAVGRNNNIGMDIGEIAGIGKFGIVLESNTKLEQMILETKPDIALDVTDYFANTLDNVRICLKNGVNVVSTSAEAVFPVADEPDACAELDALAKENNCSYLGVGMSDIFHVCGTALLAANMHSINKIVKEDMCLLEYAGPAEVRGMGLGLTVDEYHELHSSESAKIDDRNPMVWGLLSLIDIFELTVKSQTEHRPEPIVADRDYEDINLVESGIIKKGTVLGQALTVEFQTEEGVDFIGTFKYSFSDGTFGNYNRWFFYGDADYMVECPECRGDVGTTADAANRMPDVINAKAGLLTYKDVPPLTYKFKPLYEYLQK